MPVYLFTYHAYRSWMPDHERGFVQKGRGIVEPNPGLAKAYEQAAKHRPFLFDNDTQGFLAEVARDVCGRRGWGLHGAAAEPTHLHILVSWQDGTRWQEVRGKLKNIMSTRLSKRADTFGRPWFVAEASRKRVRDRKHFDYLMNEYVPKHSGAKWFEDED